MYSFAISITIKPQQNEHKATTSKRTSRLKRSITHEINFCKRLLNYVSYHFKETRKTKLKETGSSIRKTAKLKTKYYDKPRSLYPEKPY